MTKTVFILLFAATFSYGQTKTNGPEFKFSAFNLTYIYDGTQNLEYGIHPVLFQKKIRNSYFGLILSANLRLTNTSTYILPALKLQYSMPLNNKGWAFAGYLGYFYTNYNSQIVHWTSADIGVKYKMIHLIFRASFPITKQNDNMTNDLIGIGLRISKY